MFKTTITVREVNNIHLVQIKFSDSTWICIRWTTEAVLASLFNWNDLSPTRVELLFVAVQFSDNSKTIVKLID